MAKTQTQLELINSIINDGVVVKVGEHDIRLLPPPRSKVAHLHELPPPEEKMTAVERAKFSPYNIAIEVVKASIPGINADQAERLMMLAGGDRSLLAQKAGELCGLKTFFDFVESKITEVIDKAKGEIDKPNSHDTGGDLDPTSASSPA